MTEIRGTPDAQETALDAPPPADPPTDRQEAPAAAPIRRGVWGRWLAVAFGVGVLVVAGLAGILAWQATHGGVSLDPFRGRIEARLRGHLPASAIVTIGTAGFAYRDGAFQLKAGDVRLALPGMATVAVAELSTAAPPAALFGGKFQLRSIKASGLDVGVTLPSAIGPPGTGADKLRAVAKGLVDYVNAADEVMRGTSLTEVVIQNAAVSLLDLSGSPGPALHINQANWLPISAERSKMWVQVVEPTGKGWDVTFERSHEAAGDTAVAMEIEDLPVSAFAPGLAEIHDGPYAQTRLAFQARMLSRDGGPPSLRGVLSTSDGLVALNGKHEMRLNGAGITFALDATGDQLLIPSGDIRMATGRLAFEGVADLSKVGAMTLLGRVRSGALPASDGSPVALTGGGLLARVQFADGSIQIERMSVRTAAGYMSAVGQVSLLGPAASGISLALSMSEMPVADMRAIWPPFVADKVRKWIDLNVKSGRVGPATLQVALPPDHIGKRGRDKILPDYALSGSVSFRDAAFSPVPGFPVIGGAAGNIGFGSATATIALQAGVTSIPGKGELNAAGTTLIVPELGRKQPRGDLHLELSGPAAALAVVADAPPLSVAAQRGIEADALSGNAALSLDGSIPLYDSDFKDVEPSFRLALTDFSSAEPISDRLISDAQLVLEGRADSFTVKGEGTLDGIGASVDLILGDAAPDQTDVTLSLDEAARKRLGLDFGEIITGPIKASVKAVEAAPAGSPAPQLQRIALDLKDARIKLPGLGWEKGAGVPATALFTMEKSAAGTRIRELLLTGKGFAAKGEVSISAAGKLDGINLSEVSLRSGDRLSARVTVDGGVYKADVRGAALDARGIIRGIGAGLGADKTSGPTIRLALDVDEVTGENSVVLSNVAGTLLLKAGGLDSVDLKGRIGAQPFEWTVGREGGARVVRVASGDGGALIRFGGVYGKVIGGDLALDYSGAAGGAGTGVVVMRDFRLLNERALEPAVRSSNGSGNPRDVMRAQASGGDMTFSQLRLPFRQEGFVITIDDAALRGPTLGATASGSVNLPGGRIALSGTFIPAFGLNNIAGSIPLLGIILGGGRDEGLVGITYKLFGPLESPKLSMNPMSAIAPGIFRKIFEYN